MVVDAFDGYRGRLTKVLPRCIVRRVEQFRIPNERLVGASEGQRIIVGKDMLTQAVNHCGPGAPNAENENIR